MHAHAAFPQPGFFFFVSHPPLSIVTAHCQQRRIRSIWLACCLATVTMASDSLWRQGWDRENASGNDLMGKCAVIIIVHFLSLHLGAFEWKCFCPSLVKICLLFVCRRSKLWNKRSENGYWMQKGIVMKSHLPLRYHQDGLLPLVKGYDVFSLVCVLRCLSVGK